MEQSIFKKIAQINAITKSELSTQGVIALEQASHTRERCKLCGGVLEIKEVTEKSEDDKTKAGVAIVAAIILLCTGIGIPIAIMLFIYASGLTESTIRKITCGSCSFEAQEIVKEAEFNSDKPARVGIMILLFIIGLLFLIGLISYMDN